MASLRLGLVLSAITAAFVNVSSLESLSTGFQLVSSKQLQGSQLSPNCQAILQQTIQCDDYVASFREKQYRGSLDDVALTNSVCQPSCERSLLNARRRIVAVCASTPEIISGFPVSSIIETTLNGWNETCLKDKDTGNYCNDIIDTLEDSESIEEMPEKEICSYCFGAKLRMMQQSPYSAYDTLFAETLQTVNKRCNVDSPTDPLPPPINVNTTKPVDCTSGNMYSTKNADTCDSIAKANSVSAATLYFLNPSLLNCSSVPADLQLCLPEKCEHLYEVKNADEDCVVIGIEHGTSWNKLVQWNLALKDDCRNIYSTSPFWGRVICVSQPGGEYVDPGAPATTPGNGNLGGQGGNGDGYANVVVPPPKDGTVAKDATARCGEYIRAGQGMTCSKIAVANTLPMAVFLEANPSLGTAADCDGNLVPDLWYCLHPVK